MNTAASTGASLPPEVAGTVAEGRQVYVAITTDAGPHVTPELYAWSDGRLWFAAATPTLKARVLRAGTEVGAVVNVSGRSVVSTGTVEVFDVRRPRALLRGAPDLPAAVGAIARYGTRNAADLVAFVGDAATGKLGWRLPPARVLFAFTPQRGAYIENDQLAGTWNWGDPGAAAGESNDVGAPERGGERAVAAFPGPVALPARWFEDDDRLVLAPELLVLAGIERQTPIAVVVDDYTAPGPAAKRGTLLRGTATVDDADSGTLSVRRDRIVTWDGVETESAPG